MLFLILVVDKLLNLILRDAHIDSSERSDDAANPVPEFSDICWIQCEAFPDMFDAWRLVYLSVFANHSPDVLVEDLALVCYVLQLFFLILAWYMCLNILYNIGEVSHSMSVQFSMRMRITVGIHQERTYSTLRSLN